MRNRRLDTRYAYRDWAGTAPVLILGLGNILLKDEGVGVRVVEQLQSTYRLPPSVEVLDGGTGGMKLLDVIANRDELIVVDAVKSGNPPGTVVKSCNGAIANMFPARMSPHQLALADMLSILAIDEEQPGNITILGVEPVDLSTGIGLSPIVEPQVNVLVEMILLELEVLGISVEPGDPGDSAGLRRFQVTEVHGSLQ